VIDMVDPVEEYGSNDRDSMLAMMHRWAGHTFTVDPDRQPYPLESKGGHLRLYWKGLVEAAGRVDDIVSFLRA
jgi:hypothetical protein